MTLNAIFDNVKIYNVQDRLDVVTGETFELELIEAPTNVQVFTNQDPVLTLTDNDRTITASKVGESKIRFMVDDLVIKDLVIVVAESVGAQASNLGLNMGTPVPK